jgi:hypothetical protein
MGNRTPKAKPLSQSQQVSFVKFTEFAKFRFRPDFYTEEIYDLLRGCFEIPDTERHNMVTYYTLHFSSDEKIIRWIKRVMKYCQLSQSHGEPFEPFELTAAEQAVYNFFQYEHLGGVHEGMEQTAANHYIFWHSKQIVQDPKTEVAKTLALLSEMTELELDIVAYEMNQYLKNKLQAKS